MTRPMAAVAGLALLALVLAGCAGENTTQPADGDAPRAEETFDEVELQAAWLDSGRMIGLVLEGSSSCVPTATSVGLQDDGALGVLLEEPDDRPCTRDLVPRAVPVVLPETVDPSQDLEIAVNVGTSYASTTLSGSADLDPTDRSGEYLPTAGWAGPDTFVLLSWGSSGCPPVMTGAEATAADEVTATFEAIPADRVCTADMASRASVGQVSGEVADPAFLVLVGGEFDNIRIPLIGTR